MNRNSRLTRAPIRKKRVELASFTLLSFPGFRDSSPFSGLRAELKLSSFSCLDSKSAIAVKDLGDRVAVDALERALVKESSKLVSISLSGASSI